MDNEGEQGMVDQPEENVVEIVPAVEDPSLRVAIMEETGESGEHPGGNETAEEDKN